jgi:hypothetical protein
MKMFFLLSTYKFIVIPIKYRNFGAFVYDSAEKQMLNAISLVIEQRKNEFAVLLVEKTTDLSQVTDKHYHILLHDCNLACI